MKILLAVEYINGDKEEIVCDDYHEEETSIMYRIGFDVNDGEYHIPYSSMKQWFAYRF